MNIEIVCAECEINFSRICSEFYRDIFYPKN